MEDKNKSAFGHPQDIFSDSRFSEVLNKKNTSICFPRRMYTSSVSTVKIRVDD